MAEQHDTWMQGLGVGIDFDAMRKAAGDAASAAVGSVIDKGVALAQDAISAAPLPDAIKSGASTYVDFEKGVAEGVVTGVKDLADMAQSATDMITGVTLAKTTAKLGQAAVDANARKALVQDAKDDWNKAKAVAGFAATLVTDPTSVGVAIGQKIKDGYDKAAATGHGAEFIGKGVGQAAVIVGTSLIGGGEAEAADLAIEGAETAGKAGAIMTNAEEAEAMASAAAKAGAPEGALEIGAAGEEPMEILGNSVTESAGGAVPGSATDIAPPEGFEPTAYPEAEIGKVRRVRGLQSSGEQSPFSPKPGTAEGLEQPAPVRAFRGREVTREEQLHGIPSAEDWAKLRAQTPTPELSAAAEKALPVGSPDPALAGEFVTEAAQADHIVSVDRIRRMPGFAQLDESAQLKVFNMEENFAPLSPAANQSKGAKAVGDWVGHQGRGIPVDPAWQTQMLAREKDVVPKIQQRINELLQEQWTKAKGDPASAAVAAAAKGGVAAGAILSKDAAEDP